MQNFGRENFDNSNVFVKIRQTFPPSKFCAIRYCLNVLLEYLQYENRPIWVCLILSMHFSTF